MIKFKQKPKGWTSNGSYYYEKKPIKEQVNMQIVRLCLGNCKKNFLAEHKHNFLCKYCQTLDH